MGSVISVDGVGGIESGPGQYLRSDYIHLRLRKSLPQADQIFRLLDCSPLHNDVHALGGIIIDRATDEATDPSPPRHDVLKGIFGCQVRRMIPYDEVGQAKN